MPIICAMCVRPNSLTSNISQIQTRSRIIHSPFSILEIINYRDSASRNFDVVERETERETESDSDSHT